MEKDEETRDNKMYKGLRRRKGEKETQAEKRGRRTDRRARTTEEERGKSRRVERRSGPCVYVCASGTCRRRDSSGQAGRTCVFVFG